MPQNASKAQEKRTSLVPAAAPTPARTDTASPTSADRDAAWTRQAVTFRLTPERKSALRALSRDDEGLLLPTAALDLAIELATMDRALASDDRRATQPESANVSLLADELRDAARVVAGAAEDWPDIRSQLARVAADCGALRAAVSSAALLSDGVGLGDVKANLSLKDWLDRETSPARAWILAKATWTSKKSAGRGLATWEFDIRLIAPSQASSGRPPSMVFLGPSPTHGSESKIELSEALVLACSRCRAGWKIEVRSTCDDGKLSEIIATLTLE